MKSKYGSKKNRQGADMYGHWVNGEQKTAERIYGRVLRYVEGEWK